MERGSGATALAAVVVRAVVPAADSVPAVEGPAVATAAPSIRR
jgi:hypothetical protein